MLEFKHKPSSLLLMRASVFSSSSTFFKKKFRKVIKPKQFFLVGHALHTFNGADSDEKTSDDYDKVDLKTQISMRLLNDDNAQRSMTLHFFGENARRVLLTFFGTSLKSRSVVFYICDAMMTFTAAVSSLNFTDAMRYFPIFPRVYWSGPQPVGLIVSWRQYQVE